MGQPNQARHLRLRVCSAVPRYVGLAVLTRCLRPASRTARQNTRRVRGDVGAVSAESSRRTGLPDTPDRTATPFGSVAAGDPGGSSVRRRPFQSARDVRFARWRTSVPKLTFPHCCALQELARLPHLADRATAAHRTERRRARGGGRVPHRWLFRAIFRRSARL